MNSTTLNLCPYCGSTLLEGAVCTSCGGLLDPASRAATAADVGPWFVRDLARPFFPGCSLARMKQMVRDEQIGRDSIVRGPSTHGFWLRAARVPGLAHLLGTCHACDTMVGPDELTCPRCGVALSIDHQAPASFDPPASGSAASALDLIKRAQYQRIERLQSFVRLQAIALAVALGGLFLILVVYLTGLLDEPTSAVAPDQSASTPSVQRQPGADDSPGRSTMSVESEDVADMTSPVLEQSRAVPPDDSSRPRQATTEAATDSEAVDSTLEKLKDRLHDVSPDQAALIRRLGSLLEEAGQPDGTAFERNEAIQRAYRLIDQAIPNEEDEFTRLRLQALRGLFDRAQARLAVEEAMEE